MPSYLVFDVRLLGVVNPPWRRIMLRSTLSFQALHVAIQDACGWEDDHLFLFHRTDKQRTGICGSPFDDEKLEPDASRVKLRSVFKQPDDAALYVYDFGDGWEHEVNLIEIVEDKATFERRLIGGEQAFPPEDCGGIPGYLECIRVTTTASTLEVGAVPNPNATPQSDEDLRDWLGAWTPTRFHLRIAMKNFERCRGDIGEDPREAGGHIGLAPGHHDESGLEYRGKPNPGDPACGHPSSRRASCR